MASPREEGEYRGAEQIVVTESGATHSYLAGPRIGRHGLGSCSPYVFFTARAEGGAVPPFLGLAGHGGSGAVRLPLAPGVPAERGCPSLAIRPMHGVTGAVRSLGAGMADYGISRLAIPDARSACIRSRLGSGIPGYRAVWLSRMPVRRAPGRCWVPAFHGWAVAARERRGMGGPVAVVRHSYIAVSPPENVARCHSFRISADEMI